MVQMDSPTQRPNGVDLNEAFDCAELVVPSSYEAIGGKAAVCVWMLPDTLQINLGTLATVARPFLDAGVDYIGQIYGDPSLLAFDSRLLRPLGIDKDYWYAAGIEEVDIHVRHNDDGLCLGPLVYSQIRLSTNYIVM